MRHFVSKGVPNRKVPSLTISAKLLLKGLWSGGLRHMLVHLVGIVKYNINFYVFFVGSREADVGVVFPFADLFLFD
jgi:hypothetical protein